MTQGAERDVRDEAGEPHQVAGGMAHRQQPPQGRGRWEKRFVPAVTARNAREKVHSKNNHFQAMHMCVIMRVYM